MMRMLLNAGFGEMIGLANISLIQELGFFGIRQDMPAGRERELLKEFSWNRLRPICLLGGGQMKEAAGALGWRAGHVAELIREFGFTDAAIEIGNEPDISPVYGDRPDLFALAVRNAWECVQGVGYPVTVVTGGISTTGKRGLDYLREAYACGLPMGVAIGFHSYRSGAPDKPHKGFATRGAEFRELERIAGVRPLWNTEVGWHTAPRNRPFPLCWWTERYSDEDVFRMLCRERELNQRSGVQVMTVYQWRDGPMDRPLDRFGLKRMDGTLKPQAKVAE